MKINRLAAAFSVLFVFGLPVLAQWREAPTTGSNPMTLPDRTMYAGMSGIGPLLEAELVDEHKNADRKQAVVKTEVWGVDLIAAPQSGGAAKRSEAYLSYRLDQQPEIKTADKEQTFRNLSPGDHKIVVQLTYGDGHSTGTPVVLDVRIK